MPTIIQNQIENEIPIYDLFIKGLSVYETKMFIYEKLNEITLGFFTDQIIDYYKQNKLPIQVQFSVSRDLEMLFSILPTYIPKSIKEYATLYLDYCTKKFNLDSNFSPFTANIKYTKDEDSIIDIQILNPTIKNSILYNKKIKINTANIQDKKIKEYENAK